MYQIISQRTTSAIFIYHFHLKQYHISSIRFPAFRTLNHTEFNLFRLAGSLQFSAATFFSILIIPYSFQLARNKCHIFESIQEMIISLTVS